VIQRAAHAYARADRAVICWTLGITEHHNAVDNVLSLINLSLLTGHVGRYGSGVNPLRGQNNVQGGGDMGAIPNRLVGFQDWTKEPEIRQKFEKAWGVTLKPEYGLNMTQMFEAMEHSELRSLYVIGENPAQSEGGPDPGRRAAEGPRSPGGAGHFPYPHGGVGPRCVPGLLELVRGGGDRPPTVSAGATVTKALEPPGDARDDMWIICEIGKRLGVRHWTAGSGAGVE
jgi:formate dehydrogenase major subunit